MQKLLTGFLVAVLASLPVFAKKNPRKDSAKDNVATTQPVQGNEDKELMEIQLQNQQAIEAAKASLKEIQQSLDQTFEQAAAEANKAQTAASEPKEAVEQPNETQPAAQAVSEEAKPTAAKAEEKPAEKPAEVGASQAQEGFVVAREEVAAEAPVELMQRVVFNPKTQRDPTLSPDDYLLLQYREQQRLAAIEAERQRKLAEERRRREEAERLRQLELERIKDPTREVRNKIRVSGVIGQEVFIGNKIYTIGNTIFGARVVEVHPDYVIFSYKGHRFRRNVQL